MLYSFVAVCTKTTIRGGVLAVGRGFDPGAVSTAFVLRSFRKGELTEIRYVCHGVIHVSDFSSLSTLSAFTSSPKSILLVFFHWLVTVSS